MRIAYIANMRLPTEKAHGLQVMENCAALAEAGADVTLVVPRRYNTPALASADPFDYYSVPRSFAVVRLPCIDLFPLGRATEPLAARVGSTTFALAVSFWSLGQHDTVFYSRNRSPLVLLSHLIPRTRLAYEAHQRPTSPAGVRLQRQCASACGTVIAVTTALAQHLDHTRAVVLRDGFRSARFATSPSRDDARRGLGLPPNAFIVGYVGRLSTMGMSKGVRELIHAFQEISASDAHLAVVGGPAQEAAALEAEWRNTGLDAGQLHMVGEVPSARVPTWLAAFDVCAMPLPWTGHFAHDASPLKLFEYMAAGRAVLATRLPAIEEVVTHGENAWLVAPGDVGAIAAGLAALKDDPTLRERLAANARRSADAFSWGERARDILTLLKAAR